LELHLLGLSCALASACFASFCSPDRLGAGGVLAGFAVTVLAAAPDRFPEPAVVAGAAAIAAGAGLFRPGWTALLGLAGGAFAGLWVSVLREQGLPFVAALFLAAAVPAAGVWLTARRPGFAPPAMREEALLLVGGLGLVLALGPAVLDGWRSAGAFAAQPISAEPIAQVSWLPAFVVGCLVLGGLYSAWKRR
jgi:hypothetical protein